MKRSTDRILTTHVGSLIRPQQLLDFVAARQNGGTDEAAYEKCLKDSVAEVVRRQAEAGIDVVDDGEFGKSTSWSLYALKRLSGFEQRPFKPGADSFARGADRERFKVKRQVRVISAHGRITGWVLSGLPPSLAVAFLVTTPSHITTLVDDPLGVYMIVGALFLQTVGMLIIRKLVQIEY